MDGIEDFRATGALRAVPFFLALKAEALQLAGRTSEALEAIREAEGLVERFEERLWRADLHRLRGVLLTAMGADETQIEASFCEAIRTARKQKSIRLARRAETSYAEYRRQKASALGGHRFRLPLWLTPSTPPSPRLSIINEDETGARPFKGSVRYNYRLRFAEALPRTAEKQG